MNFEDIVKTMTHERLEEIYAHNTCVDWYKCNVIRAEQRRRSEGKEMILTDMNQTWKAPEGFTMTGVFPLGSFLLVKYMHERQSATVGSSNWLVEYVDVYLNDQGREVVRTESHETISDAPLATAPPKPLSLRERIELWFRVKFRGE